MIGHLATHIGEAQVVVISSAVSPQNPEVLAAKSKQIPVIPRAEMLAELMRLKFGVAIAGAHGKTTTTSMVANVLAQGGLDPTMVIGGKVNALGSHARLGRGELLVAEADESDGSFLRLSPTIVAVTNLDREHLDHYGSMERINDAFWSSSTRCRSTGWQCCVQTMSGFGPCSPSIVKRYTRTACPKPRESPWIFARQRSWPNKAARSFARFSARETLVRSALRSRRSITSPMRWWQLPSGSNWMCRVDLISKALAAFTGVERRFHLRGETNDIMVVDDYGHHPTEIKATLAAAKQGWPDRRLLVLFQPHRYTRTRDLLEEFSHAFRQADHLFLTEIYAAGEQPIPGVSGAKLAEAIRGQAIRPSPLLNRRTGLVEMVLPQLKSGDLVMTLGAGDIWKTGPGIIGRSLNLAHDAMKDGDGSNEWRACRTAESQEAFGAAVAGLRGIVSPSAPAARVHLVQDWWAGGCAC